MASLVGEPYFFGDLSATDAERMLSKVPGAYLVRFSARSPYVSSLSQQDATRLTGGDDSLLIRLLCSCSSSVQWPVHHLQGRQGRQEVARQCTLPSGNARLYGRRERVSHHGWRDCRATRAYNAATRVALPRVPERSPCHARVLDYLLSLLPFSLSPVLRTRYSIEFLVFD